MNLSDLFIESGSNLSLWQLNDRLKILGIEFDTEDKNKQRLIILYDEAMKDQRNLEKLKDKLLADKQRKKNDRKDNSNRREDIEVEVPREGKFTNRVINQVLNLKKYYQEQNDLKDLNQKQDINDIQKGKLSCNPHFKINEANAATEPEKDKVVVKQGNFSFLAKDRQMLFTNDVDNNNSHNVNMKVDNFNSANAAATNDNYNNININYILNRTQQPNSTQRNRSKERNTLNLNEMRRPITSDKNQVNVANLGIEKQHDLDYETQERLMRNTNIGRGFKNITNDFDDANNLNTARFKLEKKHQEPFAATQEIPSYYNSRISEKPLAVISEISNEDTSHSLKKDQKANLATANFEPLKRNTCNFMRQPSQNKFSSDLEENTSKNPSMFGTDASNNNNSNKIGVNNNNNNKNNFGKALFNPRYNNGLDSVNAANNNKTFANTNSSLISLNAHNAISAYSPSKGGNVNEYSASGAFMPVVPNKINYIRSIAPDDYNHQTSSKNLSEINRQIRDNSSANQYEYPNSNSLNHANVCNNNDNNENDIFHQRIRQQIQIQKQVKTFDNKIATNEFANNEQSFKSRQAPQEFTNENYNPILQEYIPYARRSSQSIQNQAQNLKINKSNEQNPTDININQRQPLINQTSQLNKNFQQNLNVDFNNNNVEKEARGSSSAANQPGKNSIIASRNKEAQENSKQSNKMFIEEQDVENIPYQPEAAKTEDPSTMARVESFISEHRKIFGSTFAFGIIIVSLVGLNHAQVINVREFTERNIRNLIDLSRSTIDNGYIAFFNLVDFFIETIQNALNALLTFTGASIWNNIYLIIFLILAVLVIRYIILKVQYRRIAYEVFEKVKNRLREIRRSNMNNSRAGIRLDEVVNDFSHVYNLDQTVFRENVVPLLREMRTKDDDIRSCTEYEAGKYYEKWQFKGF